MAFLAFIRELFLNLLFPPYCAGCQKLGTYLCPNCYEQIHFFTLPVKIKLDPSYLDHVISVGNYQEPLSSLIHMYKYKGVKAIGPVLARMVYHTTAVPIVDCVTFVPLHKKRLAERDFNQSQLVAAELARLMKVPCQDLLQRTRYTTTQASITDRSQRLVHLQDAFVVTEEIDPLPTNVLLIDDVTTTGTTLNECAKILKAAGVKKVIGLTLAHGS
ncbi:MAG TPA: ComF family protein [Patescibacteria group bacterium]